MIKVVEEDIKSRDAIKMINELSSSLNIITGNSGRGSFNDEDMNNKRALFILAKDDDEVAGCGAFREVSKDTAEVKRMYAAKKHSGIGKIILQYLEEKAKQFGYSKFILETRKCNENAVNFYLRNDYKIIDNYGKYKNRPEAVCFEKTI